MLELGTTKNLVLSGTDSADSLKQKLGIQITLDSLTLRDYHPEYELSLRKQAEPNPSIGSGSHVLQDELIGTFPLEPMQIRSIEDSDLFFRLSAFYPDFIFTYTYPDHRDTISPKAPGITIELKTSEGNHVATLLSGDKSKYKLKDILGLGVEFQFFWEISADTIRQILAKEGQTKRVIFSGHDGKMFVLQEGSFEEKEFKENTFYTFPGHENTGFTVLTCFPDMAYLKALPSTSGDQLNNPVAHVEIWHEGGPAIDAFVYPDRAGRKGGDFAIPASPFKIGLQEDPMIKVQNCDCYLSILDKEKNALKQMPFHSGQKKSYKGFNLRPIGCSESPIKAVNLEIKRRGNPVLLVIGSFFLVLASLLAFRQSKS